jgi:hypothetical protein
MRSAPFVRTVRDITGLGSGQSYTIPGSDFLSRGPRGGFTRLLALRLRYHLDITTSAAGPLSPQTQAQTIQTVTMSVSDGGGVHGPAYLQGDWMRMLENMLSEQQRPRHQIFGGEANIPISTSTTRDGVIEIPYQLLGQDEGDFARTVISMQASGLSLNITTIGANPTGVTYNAASSLRIEAVYDETPWLISVPHLRFERTILPALAGGTLPAALYRVAGLHRESLVNVNTPFATGDITRIDLDVGGQTIISNGQPEDYFGTVHAKVAGIHAESFSDRPGEANAIAGFFGLFPLESGREPPVKISDCPLGTPTYTITTPTLTAANLSMLAATVYPQTNDDIVAQCSAQGADPGAVRAALARGSYGIPLTGGGLGKIPDDLRGFLPVRVIV